MIIVKYQMSNLFSYIIVKQVICVLQVIETERMLYLVTEYASGGEIFGKLKDN
jgi:hypothetical protein